MCKHCENKKNVSYLFQGDGRTLVIQTHKDDRLEVTVAIRASYCPDCGRDLRKG